ncbi:MAG: DUF2007 domain-containing protein [Deltaproteobacteria bacterium]|jgi:hypothetical protein|nr:DUF2007 domain-containing protein [Deltaproteobacteria bacterium]MBW2384997.1 DUF2007 domain-containing protein [Deltaproteobacteria bacterium]MBW2698131.1 DUF2007 domain-containing protein [Deltaproteobacteria bacterium]
MGETRDRTFGEDAVVVESFSEKSFAEAAVSLLQSEGITAVIHADDAGHEFPNFDFASGVRLLVSEADAERAREVLNVAAGEEE